MRWAGQKNVLKELSAQDVVMKEKKQKGESRRGCGSSTERTVGVLT